ncbi:hypothetical protein C5167_031107 [Papaver somniferum]|nr:hypothetical protein C5167_031107 [Papaver somniferum]
MITMMNGDSLNHDALSRDARLSSTNFLLALKETSKSALTESQTISGCLLFIRIYKTSQRRSAAYAVAKLNFTGLEIELDSWLMAEPLR